MFGLGDEPPHLVDGAIVPEAGIHVPPLRLGDMFEPPSYMHSSSLPLHDFDASFVAYGIPSRTCRRFFYTHAMKRRVRSLLFSMRIHGSVKLPLSPLPYRRASLMASYRPTVAARRRVGRVVRTHERGSQAVAAEGSTILFAWRSYSPNTEATRTPTTRHGVHGLAEFEACMRARLQAYAETISDAFGDA